MRQLADLSIIRSFGNLKGTPVHEHIKDLLADIDKSLRVAEGDKYRVLQGQAQVLEELDSLISDSDSIILKLKAQAAPKTRQF